ncbi:Protein SlyX [Carnimonas sp. R-84865]
MSDPRHRADSNMPIHTLLEQQSARIETLEMRVTYQEDWLEKLDTRLLEQQHLIDQLQHGQRLLIERLQEARDAQEGDHEWQSMDERPPHY